jgi:hypothetical protein
MAGMEKIVQVILMNVQQFIHAKTGQHVTTVMKDMIVSVQEVGRDRIARTIMTNV